MTCFGTQPPLLNFFTHKNLAPTPTVLFQYAYAWHDNVRE